MNGSCVFADFLNAFNVYTLAVDVETGFFELVGNLQRINRAVDNAGGG